MAWAVMRTYDIQEPLIIRHTRTSSPDDAKALDIARNEGAYLVEIFERYMEINFPGGRWYHFPRTPMALEAAPDMMARYVEAMK